MPPGSLEGLRTVAYHRGAVAPFTILHISDLHFTAKGRPERVNQKAGPKEAVGGDEGTTFLDRFKSKVLSNTSRDFWPNAVIVSGDLVDRGGTDVGEGSSEFGQAVTFLKDLAKVLGINDELVLVVPGNHDVNWSANLQQGARFKNYIDAVSAPFTTPIVDESGKPHLGKYEAKDVPTAVAAPSLFEGKNPGFALIDIFGSDGASYVRTRTYSTQCDERQVTSLVREGRVLPQVEGLCARIGPEEQQNHLAPVLGDLAKAFEWRRGHFASQLFDEVLAEVGRDIERLADRQLLFRGRALHGKWAVLIGLACEAGKPEVRLASESDISYWQQAAVEDSDPWKYEESLRKLSGKKHRILVLRAADLRSEADIETAAAALQRMTNDGFEVSVPLG